MRQRRGAILEKSVGYFLLAISLSATLLPIIYVIRVSLMSSKDMFDIPPKWIFSPTFEAYQNLLGTAFTRNVFNSFVICLGATLLTLVVTLPASYALVRLKPFKLGERIAFGILVMTVIPPVTLVIPLYSIYSMLGLYDTYLGMILIYTYAPSALSLYMLWGFLQNIPVDYEESAMIDGCSRFEAFARATLPQVAPGLAASAIVVFIYDWSDYLFALILTGMQTRTIPVTLVEFLQPAPGIGPPWGNITAGSVIALLPALLFAYVARKYMTKGFVLGGGIKG